MEGLSQARPVALIFAALIAFAAGAEIGPRPLRLPDSERPVRLVDDLRVNPGNQERFVTVNRCEAEGIARIRNLMLVSPVEELWAFLPESAAGDCHWIEIGGAARSEIELSSVDVDWSYLSMLIAQFRQLHVYHFHPLSYFERCGPGQECNEFMLPISAEGLSPDLLIDNLKFAMPSPGDIYFMMETSWRFKHAHGHGGSIRHRLITPYGLVEYALTSKGEDRYAENRSTRMEGLYIKLVAANALDHERIAKLISAYPQDLVTAITKLAESMNGDYLRVDMLSR